MAKAKKGGKKALYAMPEPVPKGEILTDIFKKNWYIHSPIGKGGFGEIYAACKAGDEKKKAFAYAVKVEPVENGPLFLEQAFFAKYLKPELLTEWKATNKLKHLALPSLQGFGTHNLNGKKHRFLIMEKFGKDLWTTFSENSRKFDNKFIVNISLQIVDALHYIHSKDRVHGDIKGGNILSIPENRNTDNFVLVDFGLAEQFSKLTEFKKNPKRAHNGTMEYTSTDMHLGVPTRRSDLEILGYNMAQWALSSLPWEKCLNNCDKVYEMKNEFMESFRKGTNSGLELPKYISSFFTYVSKLGHLEVPDYARCKSILQAGLKETSPNKPISTAPRTKNTKSPARKKLKPLDPVSDDEESVTLNDAKENRGEVNNTFKSTRTTRASLRSAALNDKGENGLPPEPAASKSNARPTWRDAPAIIAGRVDKPGSMIKAKRSKK